jgi:hypothetical protein
MSRSKNEKRSRMPHVREDSVSMMDAIYKRHTWGSTEKILRRGRKLWSRLFAKRRRQLDKDAINISGL